MNAEAYALEHAVPQIRPLLNEQVQVIIDRYWPALVFFGLAALVYSLAPLSGENEALGDFFGSGLLGFPGGFIFALIGVFWAITVWSDFPVGERTHLMVLPVSRELQFGHRILAGLFVFLAVVVGMLLTGSLLCLLIDPGVGWFGQRGAFRLDGFLLMVLGLTNAYLVGTLMSIWVKRPEYWILIYIPFGLVGIMGLANLLDLRGFAEFVSFLLIPLLAGMGLTEMQLGGPVLIGDMEPIVILLVFLLLAGFTVATLKVRDGS